MASILLAEDSPTHTALIRSVLEGDAHSVRCTTNGLEAIEAIKEREPDLVVTDLRMPEMNGLELVQAIADQFPWIPTVVVTARGSEDLAVDALALGAANFVPKNSLNTLLTYVVRRTIAMSRSDHCFDNFPGRLRSPEFYFRLDNDISAIGPAVQFLVQALAASRQMDATLRVRVGTAVASALFSSICYGNLELSDDDDLISDFLSGDEAGQAALRSRASESPHCDQFVHLKVSVGEDDTRISVAHDGSGRLTRMTPAPGTPESFELEQCRGLMLMTSIMDEVIFNSDYAEVVMVKRHPVAVTDS